MRRTDSHLTDPDTPARPAGTRLRWRRRVGQAAIALVAILLIRMAVAPLGVPFGERIAAAVVGENGVSVNSLAVQLGLGNVHLALRGVSVGEPGAILSAATVRISQGVTGRAVTLINPVVQFDPHAGGEAAAPPMPSDALADLGAVLFSVRHALRSHGIDRVTLKDGRLTVMSPGRPLTDARVFRDFVATLTVADQGILEVSAFFTGVEGAVELSGTVHASDGGTQLSAQAEGLVPNDFAHLEPVRSGFAMSPRMTVRWDPSGKPLAATLEMTVAEGVVAFGRDPPRTMDEASAVLSWEPQEDLIRVDDLVVSAGASRLRAEGTITPVREGPWSFSMVSRDALFAPPEPDRTPVVVDEMIAEGRMDFAGALVHVDRFQGFMPMGRLDATMTFDVGRHGPTLSGAAEISSSSINALVAAWPPVVAYQPRQAIAETVRGGYLKSASLDFALTPLELDGRPETNDMIEGGLSVNAQFEDAIFAVEGLPAAIMKGDGELTIADKALRAKLSRGEVRVGDGEDTETLRLLSGEFAIPTMAEIPPTARTEIRFEAPLTAAVRLAHAFGVTEVQGTPLAPEDVSGTVSGKAFLTTPLDDDVTPEERRWSIEANLANARTDVPIGGQVFDRADIMLAVNQLRFAARGRAVIDGLNVDVNYQELFKGARSGAARIVLTDKDRKAKGFDTTGLVNGPVVVTIEQDETDAHTVTVDLTEAAITIPGLSKPAGRPLSAEAVVTNEGDVTEVTDLSVDGSGVAIAGSMTLASNTLTEATFDPFAFSDGDRATVNIDRRNGILRVTADARRFDARPIIKSLLSEGSGEPPEARVRLEATGDRVRVGNDTVVTDLALSAAQDGERLNRFSASGRVDGVDEGAFSVSLAPDGNTRRLSADIASVGRVLSGLGLYERMRGGRANAQATLSSDGILRGRAVAQDFVITNEATLDDLLRRARTQNGEPKSLERNVAPLSLQADGSVEEGIPFSELIIDFERRGASIRIDEAILRGTIMGGTAEGVVDLDRGIVQINGTFIPAYGLNNLFGRLPILGGILGGGRQGGLIGVTFRLSGPLDDPRLLVNPISAIAPGIFRRIFEFR